MADEGITQWLTRLRDGDSDALDRLLPLVYEELRKLATIYPSPGGSSERITLFLAIADSWNPAGKGGGIVAEGEDTQAVVLPFAQALAMVDRGEIQDAKTIVGLLWVDRLKREGKL